MYQLTQLDNNPKQRVTMILEDTQERVILTFEYKPLCQGWFFSFEYNGETYANIRLTTSYNILRAYRNWLPFGLRCETADDEEPMSIEDFVNGYAKVYLLTKQDVQATEAKYYVKVGS